MPVAAILTVIRPFLMVLGGAMVLGAMSNLVGSVTGQNPMAQVSSTMMQTLVPMMVTLMPPIIFMNVLMGMINNMMQTFTAPFAGITAFRYPTTGVV
jgi:flagellar biosynthesis protein FlhB